MHRTGSTLIQRVLNTHPRVHIWGEAGGIWGYLPHFMKKWTLFYQQNLTSQKYMPDWVACEVPVSPSKFEEVLRECIRKLYQTHPIWGFKEVVGLEFLKVVRKLFPDARLIFCLRDPRKAILSAYSNIYPRWEIHLQNAYSGLQYLLEWVDQPLVLFVNTENFSPDLLFQFLGLETPSRAYEEVRKRVRGFTHDRVSRLPWWVRWKIRRKIMPLYRRLCESVFSSPVP